ncbi:unnamed protein product [Chrysoparadoxa australica]
MSNHLTLEERYLVRRKHHQKARGSWRRAKEAQIEEQAGDEISDEFVLRVETYLAHSRLELCSALTVLEYEKGTVRVGCGEEECKFFGGDWDAFTRLAGPSNIIELCGIRVTHTQVLQPGSIMHGTKGRVAQEEEGIAELTLEVDVLLIDTQVGRKLCKSTSHAGMLLTLLQASDASQDDSSQSNQRARTSEEGAESQGGSTSETAGSNSSSSSNTDSSIISSSRGAFMMKEVYASLPPRERPLPRNMALQEGSVLCSLPPLVMTCACSYLRAMDVEFLSRTCKSLWQVCEGAAPGLKLRLFPHQLRGLAWMRERERGQSPPVLDQTLTIESKENNKYWVDGVTCKISDTEPFQAYGCRGGLLCDEPGLGKTITVLALVLRTRGCLPVMSARKGTGLSDAELLALAEKEWEHWGIPERRTALGRLIRSLEQLDEARVFSQHLTAEFCASWGMTDYLSVIPKPISLLDAKRMVLREKGGGDLLTLAEFRDVINLVLGNAIAYHSNPNHANPDEEVAQLARDMREHFNAELNAFFQHSCVPGVPVSSASPLIPSSCTLIVVPPPLLNHWINQVTLHSHESFRGNCYFDHKSSKPLPSADVLARHSLVITTYQRLTNSRETWEDCPLGKIMWFRMITDEGHSLGGSHQTNFSDVAGSRIHAERRWVTSGTPTPSTTSEASLGHLHRLLQFIGENISSQEWARRVRHPFLSGKKQGLETLRRVLSRIMIRHTKEFVGEIPTPIRKVTRIPMTKSEAIAYDTVVVFCHTNILITNLKGRTSGWQDSLLNPKNYKFAFELMKNLRLICCGQGVMIPTLKQKFREETAAYLRELHHCSEIDVKRIDAFMGRAIMGEMSSCQGCGAALQLLVVTPCAHLICCECVRESMEECKVCQTPIDADDLQKLQPGFELRWVVEKYIDLKDEEKRMLQQEDAAPADSEASAEPLLKGSLGSPAPELMEGLTSGEATGVARAAVREGALPTELGPSELSPSELGPSSAQGCAGASTQGAATPMMLVRNDQLFTVHSKGQYLITALKSLLANQSKYEGERNRQKRLGRTLINSEQRPLKAVVFSQFRSVLNLVGDQCYRYFGDSSRKGWLRRGGKMIAEFFGLERIAELSKFRNDPNCFLMLLGKDGSHGLDLSFVTHIFLMDELWDRSLEDQVVARAHRMGATGPVVVSQLLMKDTIEELMHEVNHGEKGLLNMQMPRQSKEAKDETGVRAKGATKDRAKLHYLMTELRTVSVELPSAPEPSRKFTGKGKGKAKANFCPSDGEEPEQPSKRVRFA